MELIAVILIIIGVLLLLFVLGKQTLIDWTSNDYDPSVKEVILFIVIFMIAQKELSKMLRKEFDKS